MFRAELGISQASAQELINESLEKFGSVWSEYRQNGSGRGLSEEEALILYTLSRSRAVVDVTSTLTGPDENDPLMDYLKSLGIDLEEDRKRLLESQDLGKHKKTGLLVRAKYLSRRVIKEMPRVKEIGRIITDRWMKDYLGLE